jgi:hypothetical protein
LTGWPHQPRIDKASRTSFILKLLLAAANLLYPLKHRRPIVCILAVHIVKRLRDFITRTPFEQQKFNHGALFFFDVHWHFSISTA